MSPPWLTCRSTISLGKYGSFPANLIIGRPYHLTYEIQDKKADEDFCRLRIVPTDELYADVFADEASPACATPTAEASSKPILSASTEDGPEITLSADGELVVRTGRAASDILVRQTLTQDQIEDMKREGNNAGKDVIEKLLLSHTALDQKTSFSLAKYKALKARKYMRRFQMLPVDIPNFAHWQLEEREPGKIMDMRAEMLGLVECWGNAHFSGEEAYLEDPGATCTQGEEALAPIRPELLKGRWLVVDDTCGLLTAAMAEKMGILQPEDDDESDRNEPQQAPDSDDDEQPEVVAKKDGSDAEMADVPESADKTGDASAKRPPAKPRASDFAIPFSQTNTITVLHAASQPNLSFLSYWGFDATAPNHPPHPLVNHLLSLTWLQLLKPELDTTYSIPALTAAPEELASWKPSRRGNFHRKRRRFARVRHIVDATRAGHFSGLVCASTMDTVSILQHTLPLLAGGAPVAIYSPTLEPLARLADLFSVSRRTAWTSGSVVETADKTAEELERWPGSEDFPLNPMLLLGTSIQTSRARQWQVLPGRTHPLMTERGGTDGYIFTAWKARPAEGKVAAKGKFKRRKLDAGVVVEGEVAV